MTPYVYITAGALLSFFGVLSFIEPATLWPFRAPTLVKRLLSLIAVLIGATLMAQGFAHF
jgi:hypothetical protein